MLGGVFTYMNPIIMAEFKTQRPDVCKPHVNQRHKEEVFFIRRSSALYAGLGCK